MRSPTLRELPSPPNGKTGWPWTEEIPEGQDCREGGLVLPRISIVTPSYNQGDFIEETIRSILLQGYPNLEYIVIDGGSTDGTIDAIKKYEPWIAFWMSEKDTGQSNAINKGFKRCTGDIITFCNSDDIYLKGAFLDIASRWNDLKNQGAVIGAFVYMDEKSRITGEPRYPILPHEGPIDLSLGPPGIYRLHQVSTFYGREALDDVGRWVREDLKYTMDRELLYRICRRHKVSLVNKVYGAFRLHDKSKSVSEILPFSKEFSKLHLLFLDHNKEKNRRRKEMARYHIARGYIKYAKVVNNKVLGASSLISALMNQRTLLFEQGYISTWLELLGLKRFFYYLRKIIS